MQHLAQVAEDASAVATAAAAAARTTVAEALANEVVEARVAAARAAEARATAAREDLEMDACASPVSMCCGAPDPRRTRSRSEVTPTSAVPPDATRARYEADAADDVRMELNFDLSPENSFSFAEPIRSPTAGKYGFGFFP